MWSEFTRAISLMLCVQNFIKYSIYTAKVVVVYFSNILFEYLLCARHHEGLCLLPSFFFKVPWVVAHWPRTSGLGFPHLACKETEAQGFTLSFLFLFEISCLISIQLCTVAHIKYGRHCQGHQDEQDGVTAFPELMFSQRRQTLK